MRIVDSGGPPSTSGPPAPAGVPPSLLLPSAQLDIAYDSFIRTTDPKHERLVVSMLERVWEKGDIYQANYEGYYCVDCEEYKDEGDMDAGGSCWGWMSRPGRCPMVGALAGCLACWLAGCVPQLSSCCLDCCLYGQCGRALGEHCASTLRPPTPPPVLAPADKQCPVHRKPCSLRSEENYFFALSRWVEGELAAGGLAWAA